MKNYQDHLNKITDKPKFFQAKKEVETQLLEEEMIANSTEEISFETPELSFETPLSKVEKLFVQEIVQLPSLLNEGKMHEILALVVNDEVKKYIGKIRKITMEVDDREYESVVLNLTNTPEYSADLREVVSSAFFNYKPKEADTKTKHRILHDLKTKLHLELLKSRKEEIKKLQVACVSEEEMISLLTQLSEVEKNIQILKNAKPDKI